MGIFKRRKADEAFKIQLEREALDKMKTKNDANFMLPLELEGADSVWSINKKTKAPHTITADELNGSISNASNSNTTEISEVDNISMSSDNSTQTPSGFLYKRMTEARQQSLESVVETKTQPTSTAVEPTINNITETVQSKEPTMSNTEQAQKSATDEMPKESPNDEKLDIDSLIRSLHELSNGGNSAKANDDNSNSNSEPTKESEVKPTKENSQDEKQVKPIENPDSDNNSSLPPAVDPQKAKQAEERRTSLLARCNAYLEDDEFGIAKIDTEKYKLESVESILKDFEERATQRVMKTFNSNPQPQNLTVQKPVEPPKPEPIVAKSEKESENTTVFSISDNESTNSSKAREETIKTANDNVVTPPPVKHYFTAPVKPKIEDKQTNQNNLDATRVISNEEIEKITFSSADDNNKTSIFDALNLPKPKEEINLDDFDAVKKNSASKVEAESPEFDDYNSVDDRNRIMEELVTKRKSASVKATLNLLLLIPAVFLLTPLVNSVLALNPLVPFVIELAICFIAAIVNLDSVKSLACLFNKNNDPKLASGLAIIAAIIFSIIQMLFKTDFVSICALPLISLLFNSLSDRNHFNLAISNFDLIANSNHKKAVAIIKSKNATNAIVGNSIEGGSLICCGADSINIKNFLKYTYCNNPVAKKIKNTSIIGLIVSIVIVILSLLFTDNSISTSAFILCVALGITAAPTTLLTARYPFKIANSRLKLYDSMLTGYRAADELDLCNGVAISCNDLFPEGSIRLVDMKLLSPNPIDQSMMDAAALADAIGSPIAGIFKQVSAESSYNQKSLKVDSFVYENKMGISGWVNDRRVFVGNRVLMEAHGFTNLPPIELDKKIMRKGYFPVYLVSDNVPCALLIVKYSPDEEIAYELRRLCNTGTTVLIHNCDPNISKQMICDYFGLYKESVSIMSKQGSEAYEKITQTHQSISAGAAYKGNICGLFATLTASINVKQSIIGMTALYIIFVVLGLTVLCASLFTPVFSSISNVTAIIFQLVSTLIICLPPLIKRP